MKKRLFTALAAAAMAATFCFSSMASSTAGWKWIDGYCYYFTDKDCRFKLIKTKTPDGYYVDDQGRWLVHNIPDFNGYGSIKLGTDSGYGKLNDADRAKMIRDYVAFEYAHRMNLKPTTDNAVDMPIYGVVFTVTPAATDGAYVELYAENKWNDSPEFYESNRDEMFEVMIKAMCGDHVGQELFDAIRAAAEPAGGGTGNLVKRDAEGNIVTQPADENGFQKFSFEQTASSGDGINFDLLDLNYWNGRKTDYGKTIWIQPGTLRWNNACRTPFDFRIIIK